MDDHHRSADDAGPDFSGKVCVITGAAGGIGSETAKLFASHGARVAVLDRPGTQYQSVVSAITEAGGIAVGFPCDITEESNILEAADLCRRELGNCDVLVNNAAALQPVGLLDIHVSDWNRVEEEGDSDRNEVGARSSRSERAGKCA
jgi:NAD(P)-dependent dehydrogenase (short-subunit alcohol dehydrogenase family)